MKSDPIILKSLNSKDMEVKCTFLRPYAFLNDSTATRGKPYKIVNKLDSKSSQIVVRGIWVFIQMRLCNISECSYAIWLTILVSSLKFWSLAPIHTVFIV